MARWIWLGLATVVTVTVSLQIRGATESSADASVPSKAILEVVDNENVEFVVTREGRYSGSVTVRNIGTEPARLTGKQTGCGCTSLEVSSDCVPPGESVAATLTVDVQKNSSRVMRCDLDAGLLYLQLSASLLGEFQSNPGKAGELHIDCIGRCSLPIRLSLEHLQLGEIPLAAGAVIHTIPIAVAERGCSLEVLPHGSAVTVVESPKVDPDSRLLTVKLQVDPGGFIRDETSPVSFVQFLSIVVTNSDGTRHRVELPLSGRISPCVSASPSRIVRGPLTPGETIDAEVRIKGDGVSVTNISDVSVVETGPCVRLVRTTVVDGHACLALSCSLSDTNTTSGVCSLLVTHEAGQSALKVPYTILARQPVSTVEQQNPDRTPVALR